MLDRLITLEQSRLIVVSTISPVLAYYTATNSYIYALTIVFGFNIWAGMRADGVAIKRCQNFKFSKFKNALSEFFLYIAIIYVVYSVMSLQGDKDVSLLVVKTLSYIFEYVYLQNAFRNLVIAYPRRMVFHIIYHVIRLEFTRAMPENVREIIERYEREHPEDVGIDNKENNVK